ncbi:MAG: V-type ATP synthase subunit B [Promethearchaeia archaeon]
MSIIYDRTQHIMGPLIFLKNNHEVVYGEMVNITLRNGEKRNGKVIKMNEEFIAIQVFEETRGLSVKNAKIIFTDDLFRVKLSKNMIGRTFNSLGKPINIKSRKVLESDIITDLERIIDSSPINPYARKYPDDIIFTGISALDGLFTLIRGQKLPIFSGQGLPHNKMAAQIVSQARVRSDEDFIIIFCGIGIIQDEALYFMKKFQESGNIKNIISFINFADDPVMERLLIPRVALTTAEYFAFDEDMHVLVILTDMTNYAEALRELSSAKEEIPSRKGYPGYLYSDLASLFERTGQIKGKSGSITQIPILTMPNDDISHPIPDTAGYITEGQIVLNRDLHKKGLYPPLEVLASISRLMKDAIGDETTREDHADVNSQLLSSYSNALEVRDLLSIIGEDGLDYTQKQRLEFGELFEDTFMSQSGTEFRPIEKTLDLAWKSLSILPSDSLLRIHKKYIDQYYKGVD